MAFLRPQQVKMIDNKEGGSDSSKPKPTRRQKFLRKLKKCQHSVNLDDLNKILEKFGLNGESEDSDIPGAETVEELLCALLDPGSEIQGDGGEEEESGSFDVGEIPGCFWDDPSSLFHCFSGLYEWSRVWKVAEHPIAVAFFQSVVLPVLLPMAVGFVSGYLGKKYLYEYWPELPRYGLTIYRIPGGSSAPHTDRFLDAKVHFLSSLDNTTLGGLDYGN